jgi:two-component system, LytTR family, sensor kinase
MIPSLAKKIIAVRARFESGLFVPLLLLLALIAVINALQSYAPLHTGAGSLPLLLPILASKLVYYWYFVGLAMVIQWHSRRIPLNRQNVLRWSAVHLATLACSFLLHELLSLAIDTLLHEAGHSASLWVLLFSNSAVWIETFAYIMILLGFSLVAYQRINRENEIRCALLEARLTKTKLQELRSSIQPTFLFNTLQSILDLVRERRNHDANHVLSLLSDFLRTTVYDNDRDEITLAEEMRFLNQFIEIEQVRSRRPFHVHQEIAFNVRNAVVPNFILQPIVEELAHRKSREDQVHAELIIRADRAGMMLQVEIEVRSLSDAAEADDVPPEDLVLEISRKRLVQLYGSAHEMSICRSNGSVLVQIRLPYRELLRESEGTFIGEKAS